MRAVIDTCIVVDALQNREPFCRDAQAIFLLCANRQYEGFLTAKSVTDIYYLTHRQTHSEKTTRDVLKKLCTLFGLLDTRGLDIRKAISDEISDFEDAVMIETAIRSGMDCIVTRNIRDYKNAFIPVYTPEEFLELLARDQVDKKLSLYKTDKSEYDKPYRNSISRPEASAFGSPAAVPGRDSGRSSGMILHLDNYIRDTCIYVASYE
ncbi:PIN domain-containing protein [Oscillospiraceae bacterium NTUH-002-81]|nr:PIN domain-containing protein [Oscillospiraceae bacterium NTUH-002-81]